LESGFSKDLNDLMSFPKSGIYSTVLAKAKDYNVTLMCLSKGTDIDEHTSTRVGFVDVIKGSGTFVLEGKKIDLKPGVFIFMPKDAPHSLSADEDLAILLTLVGEVK
jgi:quercetin dioxygenase-like cupin family protein